MPGGGIRSPLILAVVVHGGGSRGLAAVLLGSQRRRSSRTSLANLRSQKMSVVFKEQRA